MKTTISKQKSPCEHYSPTKPVLSSQFQVRSDKVLTAPWALSISKAPLLNNVKGLFRGIFLTSDTKALLADLSLIL